MKTEISQDAILESGDVIELHFKSRGWTWIRAAQIAIIESRLAERQDTWIVQAITDDTENKRLIFRVLVTGTPVALIIVGILAVVGGVFVFLSLDKVYKITNAPMAKVSVLLLVGALFLFAAKALR